MNLNQAMKNKNIRAVIEKSWSLSWPMMFVMFFVFLIGLCDVYVAGRFGKEIQAAYGVVFQVYFIFSIIASALSIGSVSVISRLFTSARKEEFHIAVDSSLIVTVVSGILFGIFGILSAKSIINILNIPAPLKEFAVPLMQVYSAGLLFNYLLINTNAILRACGLVRKSLLNMGIVCLLNIALIFFFAFRTPLGFKGIALATCCSTFLGSILNIASARRMMTGRFEFSLTTIKKIFNIGWPAGILQILWQLGAMVIFLILASIPVNNIEIIAAFTNGLKIESAVFLPAFAFNMAAAVVVGNLLGKGDREGAFAGGMVTAAIGMIIVTVLTLVIMLNARGIASFLSNNDIVINESIKYIYISLISEPFMAWGVILSGALNGAGDTRSVMVIIALSVWLVRIPLSYILGIYFGLGAAAVWWSMNLSILAQAVFVSRRYLSKEWMED